MRQGGIIGSPFLKDFQIIRNNRVEQFANNLINFNLVELPKANSQQQLFQGVFTVR